MIGLYLRNSQQEKIELTECANNEDIDYHINPSPAEP